MLTATARRGREPTVRWKASLVAMLTVVLLATGCVQVQAADGGFVMGGNIVVRDGEVARDDVVAVGGNVRIDGRATRDVVVVGGRLEINGEVERSVSSVFGTLVLGPRARVGRDVVVVGGRLQRANSARIGGELVNVSIGGPQVENWFPGVYGFWGYTPFAWIFRSMQLFWWLLLALVTVALVGDRVSSASHAIAREPVRMGVIGLVGIFALFFAFLVLLVLSFLIIGIPFLLALFFMTCLAYIFGAVAVFQAVGNRVMRVAGRPEASQIAIVLAGGLVMGILRYVPIFGGLIWFLALLVGLGSVFATRFGTGRPWVRRSVPPPPPPGGTPYQQPPPAPEPQPSAASEPEAPAQADAMEFDGPAAGEVSFEQESPAAADEDDEERS